MSDELRNLKRRVTIARDAPGVTCGASRHVNAIALTMAAGRPVHDLPQDMAASMLAVLESLWKARAELARLKGAMGAGDSHD